MESAKQNIIFRPIGVVHSPYKREKLPDSRPHYLEKTDGSIELFDAFRQGLNDLDGFSRIWVLFHFDLVTDYHLMPIPRKEVVKRGLFSTRSPSRPNHIGLTCVEVLMVDIKKGIVEVAGLDILDGTPVLDIKPYIPRSDSFPDSRTGWLENLPDIQK